MSAAPLPLRLLGRQDCPLCEELLHAVQSSALAASFTVQWLDVDADEAWRRRYGLRVPVLLDAWDEVVCEGRVPSDVLDAALQSLLSEQAREPRR